MPMSKQSNLFFVLVFAIMSSLPLVCDHAYAGHNGARRSDRQDRRFPHGRTSGCKHKKCENDEQIKQKISNHQKQKQQTIVPIIIGSSNNNAVNGTTPSAFVFTTESAVSGADASAVIGNNQPFEFDTIGQLNNINFDGISTIVVGQTGTYVVEYRVVANTASNGTLNQDVLVLDVTTDGLTIPGSVQAAPSPSILDPVIAQIVHGSLTSNLAAGARVQLRNVSGQGVVALLVSTPSSNGNPSVSALFRIFKLD